jgi:hypothetical protein
MSAWHSMGGILLSAHHQRRALHAREVGKHVEGVVLPARSHERLEHFRIAHYARHDVGIARGARIERKRNAPPGLREGHVAMPLEQSTTRHGADLWPSQFSNSATRRYVGAARGSRADQDQLGWM